MKRHVGFIHTALANEGLFDRLLNEIAPDMERHHVIDEEALRLARESGATSTDVERRIAETVAAMTDDGAAVILCTCSTIGGAADSAAGSTGRHVLRVDRPMADKAVASGRRILMTATLESTLEPTHQLLTESARRAGKQVTIRRELFADAWQCFERGDLDGYNRAIAEGVRTSLGDAEVVVLSQASMMGAEALLGDVGAPVLSSPRLGVAAAVGAMRVTR
ncbi:MAG: aspartate/glutamate racemase family protein [Candidatus Poribacteria bacterium]|nr:aspartate/glutamate racemase family protein [Candidatus Poribacteria bacterium]